MKRANSLLLAVLGLAMCCGVARTQAEESKGWKPTPEEIRSIAVQALQERETQTAGLCFRWGRCGYWPGYASYSYYRPAYFNVRYYAAPVYYPPAYYNYPVYSYSAYYPTYAPAYYPTYSYPAVYSNPTYYSGYSSYPVYRNAYYAPAVVVPAPVYSGCYYW